MTTIHSSTFVHLHLQDQVCAALQVQAQADAVGDVLFQLPGVLGEAGDAQEDLVFAAFAQAFLQLSDGAGLVPGGFKIRDKLESLHGDSIPVVKHALPKTERPEGNVRGSRPFSRNPARPKGHY